MPLLLLLAGVASADPIEILAPHLLREAQADCMLYRRPTRLELARCLARSNASDESQAQWDLLLEELGPEYLLVSEGTRSVTVRPRAALTGGPYVPIYADGDEEPGMVSARADVGVWGGTQHFEVEVDPRIHLDVSPFTAGVDLPVARAAVSWKSLSLELGQKARWYGPDHASSLTWTDNAKPLPGVVGRAEGRLPGKADKLGRFGLDVGMGLIPGERTDADNPGWLIYDIRWLVRPWLELSATRTSIFGGWEDGEPLPLDWGEVVLPLTPHTEDDPDKTTADTDEHVFLDLRLTFPLRRWLDLPIDYLELYYQYAGENVYMTDSEVLSLPFIQGVASVAGAEAMVRPVFFGFERAIVEDDYHRWYTGHRVYHDGWTRDGRSMGFAWGGDAWYWTGWVGLAGAGPWVARASYTHTRKWQVPDVINDHVFVFPGAERFDLGGLEVDRRIESVGWVSVETAVGTHRNADFVDGDDAVEWRVAVTWRSGPLPVPGL